MLLLFWFSVTWFDLADEPLLFNSEKRGACLHVCSKFSTFSLDSFMVWHCELYHWWGILWTKRFLLTPSPLGFFFCLTHFIEPLPQPVLLYILFFALIHNTRQEESKCLTPCILTKCFPFLHTCVWKAGRNANESKLHHILLPEKA